MTEVIILINTVLIMMIMILIHPRIVNIALCRDYVARIQRSLLAACRPAAVDVKPTKLYRVISAVTNCYGWPSLLLEEAKRPITCHMEEAEYARIAAVNIGYTIIPALSDQPPLESTHSLHFQSLPLPLPSFRFVPFLSMERRAHFNSVTPFSRPGRQAERS